MSTSPTPYAVSTHTLDVPGARLYYEVRGSGPVLAVLGAPMGASGFAALADLLAADHTVLTYDPRGTGGTTVADRTQSTPHELLADDVSRILSAVTDEPAVVFGSSGGGSTGLALVAAHPEQVGILVVHEPPVIRLLEDADAVAASFDEIYATYLRAGGAMAMREFLLTIGILGEEGSRQLRGKPVPEPHPAPAVPADDLDFFYANQVRETAQFEPDLGALVAAGIPILVGVGAASAGQLSHRAALALADRLGLGPIEFPGDHTSFASIAPAFADRLREVLRDA